MDTLECVPDQQLKETVLFWLPFGYFSATIADNGGAPMANDQLEFFATCPQGFEHILADELKRLRAQSVRPLKGGVAFFGTKVEGYRALSVVAHRFACSARYGSR